MKKTKFWLNTLLILIFCVVGVVSPVFAENNENELSVEVITDKDSYKATDEINIMTEVTNKSTNGIENVSIEGKLPRGLKLKEQQKSKVNLDSMKSGQIEILAFTASVQNQEVINNPNDEGNNAEQNPLTKTNTEISENDQEVSKSPFTGNMGGKIGISCFVVLVIIAIVLLIKYKNARKMLAILLCISLSCSVLGYNKASAAPANSSYSTVKATKNIMVDGKNYEFKVEVKYQESQKEEIPVNELKDPYEEEISQAIFESQKQGSTSKEMDGAVIKTVVDYQLKEGTGKVFLNSIDDKTGIGKTAGAIGKPVDILLTDDTLEEAKISFYYDPTQLGETDLTDLKVAWYNNEEGCMELLEDSVVDLDSQSVSVETTHFSEYVLVDSKDWYENWMKPQMIIRDTTSQKPQYFNIGIALDASGSMSSEKLNLAKEATKAFIKDLEPKDMIAVIPFSDSAKVAVQPVLLAETTFDAVNEKIDSIYSNGGTDFYSALNTCATQLLQMDRYRKESYPNIEDMPYTYQPLIIFLSDGQDQGYSTSQILKKLKELNYRVIAVGLGYDADETLMRDIAEETGGQYVYAEKPEDLNDVFLQIKGEYVGLTKDTDGDKIPDLVETSGMRNQYGEIITTDPNNPDTDGDGYSDFEEIGSLVDDGNRPLYFKMISSPTIPSVYLDKAKFEIKDVQTQIKTNTNDLIGAINDFKIKVVYKEVQMENPTQKLPDGTELKDYLSEYVYQSPSNFKLQISDSELPNCLSVTDTSKAPTLEKQEDGYTNKSVNISLHCNKKEGILQCSNKHQFKIRLVADNGEESVWDYNSNIALQEEWKKNLGNWATVQEKKLVEKDKKFIDDVIDDTKSYGSEQNLIENITMTYAGIGEAPKGLGEALKNKILNELKSKAIQKANSANSWPFGLFENLNASQLIKDVANMIQHDDFVLEVNGQRYRVKETGWANLMWMINVSLVENDNISYNFIAQKDQEEIEATYQQYINSLVLLENKAIKNYQQALVGDATRLIGLDQLEEVIVEGIYKQALKNTKLGDLASQLNLNEEDVLDLRKEIEYFQAAKVAIYKCNTGEGEDAPVKAMKAMQKYIEQLQK